MAERDLLADTSISSANDRIVKLYFSFQDAEHLYLIMEYVPGGDMMNLLIIEDTFSDDWTRFYIAETVLAIESIHKLNYIHRFVLCFMRTSRCIVWTFSNYYANVGTLNQTIC